MRLSRLAGVMFIANTSKVNGLYRLPKQRLCYCSEGSHNTLSPGVEMDHSVCFLAGLGIFCIPTKLNFKWNGMLNLQKSWFSRVMDNAVHGSWDALNDVILTNGLQPIRLTDMVWWVALMYVCLYCCIWFNRKIDALQFQPGWKIWMDIRFSHCAYVSSIFFTIASSRTFFKLYKG